MKSLSVSESFKLPLTAITQRFAALGTIGSGKTYGASKLAEEMLGVSAQVVVIDPVGVWWGLRVGAKKGDEGIPINVFGGLHGDLPLEAGSGKLIADLIVDRRISAVIDLSQIEHDTDRARWCSDFGARFFFRKNQKPSAVHLFIEEAQEFLPEEPQKNETRMLHVFVRMAKLGRNFGIGMTLISQRPQDVSKKALNLTECILAFRTVGPHERAAIKRWVDYKGAPAGILDALPTLATGECRIVSREWLKLDDTIKISAKRTADVSSTPQHGSRKIKPRDLSPVDIEALRSQMAEAIERSKQDDPTELRKQLAEQKSKVAKLEREVASKPAPLPPVKPQPVMSDSQLKRAEAAALKLSQAAGKLEAVASKASVAAERLRASVMAPMQAAITNGLRYGGPIHEERIRRRVEVAPPATTAPAEVVDAVTGKSHKLGDGERKIAIAIAQHRSGCTREQLSVLTGYKTSTRNAYLYRLQTAGLIEPNGKRFVITDEGLKVIGHVELLPTGADLAQYWYKKLPDGEGKILELVIENPGISREDIGERCGFKTSTRNAYIYRLSTRELVYEFEHAIFPAELLKTNHL